MKKIILLSLIFILILLPSTQAKISEGHDSFTGGEWYKSGNYIDGSNEWIGLYKVISKKNVSYGITFSEETLHYIKFARETAEIKVDDNSIKQIPITEVSSRPTLTTGISLIGLTATVPQEQIEKIKIAQKVALKFKQENGTSVTVVLPDSVLAEWQQVINTEK